MMIRLNCFFQATDGDQYKDALRAAVALTEKSLNHAGCIAYDVFQGVQEIRSRDRGLRTNEVGTL